MKMPLTTIGACVILVAMTAPKSCHGQQLPDASKLAPVYQQQRNFEADRGAQCYAVAADLQAKIADLERQLEEAKKKPE